MLRPLSPYYLFVACDGPNPKRVGEVDKVYATRNVIETDIDWPCNINRLYSNSNQGCRLGVSRAITWFFSHVEQGIILEDDCVPHLDFFSYCSTLLERYRHDTRVWSICGSNFQNGNWRGNSSYYFSRYNHCWGWATWRRCWNYYDSALSQWPFYRDSGLIKSNFEDSAERCYWTRIFDNLYTNGRPDTWDFQLSFVCFSNNGLSVVPNRNLVCNRFR